MARPIVILTDSGSDITASELQEHNVKRIPMSLTFEGKESFLDLPLRYQPYARWKDKLIAMFVK